MVVVVAWGGECSARSSSTDWEGEGEGEGEEEGAMVEALLDMALPPMTLIVPSEATAAKLTCADFFHCLFLLCFCFCG